MDMLMGRRIVKVRPGEDGSIWLQAIPEDKFKGSKWDRQRWCRHDCCRSDAILATVRDYAPMAPRKNIDLDLSVGAAPDVLTQDARHEADTTPLRGECKKFKRQHSLSASRFQRRQRDSWAVDHRRRHGKS